MANCITHSLTELTLVLFVQVKCHQYWPQVGSVSYGNFTVTLIDSMEVANYCVRTLRLAKVRRIMELSYFVMCACVYVCACLAQHILLLCGVMCVCIYACSLVYC